jgi:subtilisin family serine protease
MKSRVVLIGLSALFLFFTLAGVHAEMSKANFDAHALSFPYIENRVLVRFSDAVPQAFIESVHQRVGAKGVENLDIVGALELVMLPDELSVAEALESYRKDPSVLYAEPDFIVHVLATPDDPNFSRQWALWNTGKDGAKPGADIDALRAWDITTGSSNVVVAVVDTGVKYNHPDLAANMWRNSKDCNGNGIDEDGNGYIDDCYGIDVSNKDSDPMDVNGHGTHAAGIIGAVGDNGKGISGINWDVSIMACKFLGADGYGTTSDALRCLQYVKIMKDRGVNIVAVNASWGSEGFSQALFEAIDTLRKRGILFVAAAGNLYLDNDAFPIFPGSYYLPNVISVAATDDSDRLPSYSDFGRGTVHIGAPGSSILSTAVESRYIQYSGTSMSAPHVAGVAALLKAYDPEMDWKSVKNRILAGGEKIPELKNTISQRRLSAFGALTCADSIVKSRILPVGRAIQGHVGTPVDLSAIHIKCGIRNGAVLVRVEPTGEIITLRDNGLGTDRQREDGVYSGQWVPSGAGLFTLVYPGGDKVDARILADGNPTLFGPEKYYYMINSALSLGDFNSDGRNDIIGLRSSFSLDAGLYLFPQTRRGSIGAPVKYQAGDPEGLYDLCSIDVGDLNGDGRLDVAVSRYYTPDSEKNRVVVFLQNASGGLLPMQEYATVNARRLKIGDFNGDGLGDVAAIGWNTEKLDIFLQNHNGTLDTPVTYQVKFTGEVHDFTMDVGDVNNDGLDDIVIFGALWGVWSDTPRVAVMLQRRGGTMNNPVFYRLPITAFASTVAIGDVNGDGLKDVVVGLGGNKGIGWGASKPYIAVFRQNRSGTLDPAIIYRSYDGPGTIKIVDMNADGRNDVVVTHGGWGALAIYFQSPGGELFPFVLLPANGVNCSPQGLAIGDVNGDGKNDIISGDANAGLTVRYGNENASPIVRSINVLLGGNGRGMVVSDPPGINCGSDCSGSFTGGTYVVLKPFPAPGSRFAGWRGTECYQNIDGSCTVVENLNSVVQGDFELKDK